MERQIRERIVQLLTDAATSADDRIFPMRWRPLSGANLPAVCVYSNNSPSENEQGDLAERRTAMIDLVIYAAGPHSPESPADSADYMMETLRGEIEAVLNKPFDTLVDGVVRKEYKGYKVSDNREMRNAELLQLNCVMTYAFEYVYAMQEVL